MKKQYQGFTLMELLVVLVIIGIVASMGMPSFNSAIRSAKLTTIINEFISTLSFARSEAVKRNQRVVVAKTGANWENGWQVFVDVDGNNLLDGVGDDAACTAGNDCILQVHEALPGLNLLQPNLSAYTLRGNNNFTNFIAYTPMGLSNTIGRFVLCNNTDKNVATIDGANSLKLVLVNILGRARISTVDALPAPKGNGIPEDDSGVEQNTCIP